ncbi:MAG TPA: ABC transporter permease [Puia sp.]|uniref:ABC transporter permease n=1 Tax=Puia sp. TaxID=2045100 RepID=UPI002B63AB7C|nr:ABC transporter permease [Puia sp.]HVU96504.1 ABC transporter permease [Puia sp.]
MIKNYLRIAFRSLRRNKLFSLINIFGLALSMAIGMMVILRTKDALSYDRFHPAFDRIYRVINRVSGKHNNLLYAASTPAPLLPLVKDLEVFEEAVSVTPTVGQDVSYGDKALSMQGAFTQSSFFRIFGFSLAKGVKTNVLEKPGNIVLSAEAALNLFGKEDPLGKIVTVNKLGAFLVSGVLNPVMEKSHLKYDYYLPSSSLVMLQKKNAVDVDPSSWNTFQRVYTYVRLKPDVSKKLADAAVAGLSRYVVRSKDEDIYQFELQRLCDLTPASIEIYNDNAGGIGWAKIWAECGIALLILLAGCFNYTNMTIARGLTRSKEVGIRKVAGARRYQVFIQYVVESTLIAFLALILAYLILHAILRYKPFNDGYEFMPDVRIGLSTLLLFFLFSFFSGLMAGVLPAWMLSSFKPAEVLKNIRTKRIFGSLSLQKTLIVFQFSLSLVVLIFLSAFYTQFSHLAEVDPGFRTADIVSVSLEGADPELLTSEFLRLSGVRQVSAMSANFGIGRAGSTRVALGTSDKEPIQVDDYFVDHETAPMMNLKFVAGADFSDGKSTEKENYILINEMTARTLGFKDISDAVGKDVRIDDSTMVQIKGIVKDFYFRGPGIFISPLVLRRKAHSYNILNVRVANSASDVVRQLEIAWKKIYPHQVFSCYRLDKELKDRNNQTATISLLGFLALTTITIGSLGLLGLVVYTVEVRKKEISLRRVIGARVDQILALVSKGFVRLLLISGCISLPIGYVLAILFLQNFANRSSFGIIQLLSCFGFLLLIGLITILSQTWEAAKMNPAPNLRIE